MSHETLEHLDRLDQRRRYLDERIAAKQRVGWEVVYDVSERDALAWAVKRLTEMNTATAAEHVPANG
jgi:hypothetical protein